MPASIERRTAHARRQEPRLVGLQPSMLRQLDMEAAHRNEAGLRTYASGR